mmetsp:Transcript_27801/g.75627  ORF Transcript_27801/g.75627 Transcript_27801/m.75627 type:complete len:224 (+) Transcript_27801:2112-2783(+)
MLCGKTFVGTRNRSGLRGNVGIVRQQKSSLAGVDHFVALATNGTCYPLVAGVLPLPEDSQRVGGVFQQNSVVFVAKVFDGIHVGQLSSHVGNQDVFAVGIFLQFLFQIGSVHDMVLVGLDVNGLSVRMLNGRRNGSECESVRQHLASWFQSGRLEQQHQGGSTRVESDAVLESGVITDLLLAERHSRLFTRADIVSVKTSGLHKFKGGLLSFYGNGIWGLDIL